MTRILGRTFGCAAFSLAIVASPAIAQDTGAANANTGFYQSIDLGAATVGDVRLDYSEAGGSFGGRGTQDTLSSKGDLKSAFNIGGATGYDFGAIRADVQVDYARNRIKGLTINSINGAQVTSTNAAGLTAFCLYEEIDGCSVSGNRLSFNGPKLRQLSVLANLWYDLPIGYAFTAYAGGGAGVGGFEVEGDGKARFAWQLGAGAAFHLSRMVALTANYRHRWINGATFTDSDDPGYALRVGKLRSNIFSAGLRFTF